MLIIAQAFRQRVQFEPLGAIDLRTLWDWSSFRVAEKDYLDLPVFSKSANEGDARDLDLKSDLFTQFAADGIFGLLARINETAGNAPAAAGAKAMVK